MTVKVRITRKLLDEVRSDLSRPHRFAAERIGFLYGTLVVAATPLVLMTGYEPVDDDRYIDDRISGARIDTHAIRQAMQGVLDRGQGGFHVHMHGGAGRPLMSRMDAAEIPPVVTGLRRVGVTQAHGIVLLNEAGCAAWVWLPGAGAAAEVESFSVVGFPTQKFGATFHVH